MSKSGFLLMLLGTPGLAWAQVAHTSHQKDPPAAAARATSPPPVATSASAGSALQLSEVVVTAERRTESAQKAALSIQVLSGEELVRAGVNQAADLNSLVPGLQIGQGGNATQVFIRGVGDFSATPLSSPGVAFNVDGVYVADPQQVGQEMYDLQRVEVLKGPQGTLYGRDTTGGAINLITNRPKLSGTNGYVTFEGGNYSLKHGTGAINVPISSTLAIRGAFNIVSRNGYLSDGTDDDHEQSGRIELLWQPTQAVSWLTTVDYSHVGGEGAGYAVGGNSKPAGMSSWVGSLDPKALAWLAQQPGGLGFFEAYGYPPPPGQQFTRGATGLKPFVNNRSLNASTEFKDDLGWATLTILPAYRESWNDEDFYNSVNITEGMRTRETTAEARLSNSSEWLKWVTGVYYFSERVQGFDFVDEGVPFTNRDDFNRNNTHSYSAYGQATYSVTHRLRLIAGARYTQDYLNAAGVDINQGAAFFLFPVGNGCGAPVGGFPPAGIGPTGPFPAGIQTCTEAWSGKKMFSALTWKAGWEYDLTAQNMLYFTASTGYKSGGFNFEVAPNAYQPEKLESFELGSKNRFLDNRLQVNLGLFRWDYRNHQEGSTALDNTGAVSFLIQNVGNATLQGGDLSIAAQVTSRDTFRTAVEYDSSSYDTYLANVFAGFGPPTPAQTGCRLVAATQPGPFVGEDCAGFAVARAPLWSGSGSWEHRFGFSGGQVLDVVASTEYSSARWATDAFVAAVHLPSYITGNVDVTFVPATGDWTLTGYVHNLGETVIGTGAEQANWAPTLAYWNVNPPRMYGARFTYNF